MHCNPKNGCGSIETPQCQTGKWRTYFTFQVRMAIACSDCIHKAGFENTLVLCLNASVAVTEDQETTGTLPYTLQQWILYLSVIAVSNK